MFGITTNSEISRYAISSARVGVLKSSMNLESSLKQTLSIGSGLPLSFHTSRTEVHALSLQNAAAIADIFNLR
jgi:hypothetical protein